ncbi:MAG TPA: hypothetical protein VNP04_21005 [Alphaproteobacteria bacterium]|nr:hypothetical protein [Alphaproteobacteria bacterium]
MELTHHPIAANNFLFGVSNFLVLPLPAAWELVRGPFEPEVDRQIRRGDTSWVQEGRTMYLLIHRGRRATVECHIAIAQRWTPLHFPSGKEAWHRGQIEIGGHAAAYILGTQLRGWWSRKRVVMLRTAFYCDALARRVGIELLGEGSEERHLQELLLALSQAQCH